MGSQIYIHNNLHLLHLHEMDHLMFFLMNQNIHCIQRDCYDCSHIISNKNSGKEHINNIVVCCNKCNLQMGSENLLEYIEKNWDKSSTQYQYAHNFINNIIPNYS